MQRGHRPRPVAGAIHDRARTARLRGKTGPVFCVIVQNMNRLNAALIPAFLVLASAGIAGERLPDERSHQARDTRERMPETFSPMDESELADTRGVVNAPQALSAPETGKTVFPRDNEVLQQQQADRAALIVELDSRIEDTARALQGAPDHARPALEQRFRNLNTLRQGF